MFLQNLVLLVLFNYLLKNMYFLIFQDSGDDTKATVMYVLIAVAVFLIVIWGIITIIKCKLLLC